MEILYGMFDFIIVENNRGLQHHRAEEEQWVFLETYVGKNGVDLEIMRDTGKRGGNRVDIMVMKVTAAMGAPLTLEWDKDINK